MVIERNARVQVQLIEDLLDMSRIISGKLRLNLEPDRPGDVRGSGDPNGRTGRARERASSCGADLPGGGRPIYGDPDRLQQVVWNLLSNAVKFTPEGGWVEVCLEHGRLAGRPSS